MAKHRIERRLGAEPLEDRRLLALDPLFGIAGVSSIPVTLNRDDLSTNMRIFPDGKIIMVGDTFQNITDTQSNVGIARFTATGAIDTSFGTAGIVSDPIGHITSHSAGVAYQTQGANVNKIIVAGYTFVSSNDLVFNIATNGDYIVTSASRAFQPQDAGGTISITGGNGWTVGTFNIIAVAGGVATISGVPATAGATGGEWQLNNYDFVVSRYFYDAVLPATAGMLDTSFGNNGHAIFPVNGGDDFGMALGVQPWDDKIVVAGYTQQTGGNYDFAVMRLNQNGSLDATFNLVGYAVIDFTGDDFANAIDFDTTTHNIVVAGSAGGRTNGDLAFTRLTPNGVLDTTFGTNGKMRITDSAHFEFINSLKVYQATNPANPNTGKIIAVGTKFVTNANYDPILVRLNTNGTLDTNFGTGGTVVGNFGNSRDWGNSVDVQFDNKIVVAGSTEGSTNYDYYVERFNNDGSPDDTFNGTTNIYINSVSTKDDFGANVQVVPTGLANAGQIIVSGSTFNTNTTPQNFDFLVVAYVGTPPGTVTKPVLNLADITTVEGDAGTTVVQFVLKLSATSTSAITVNYATQDGTAKAGIDYVAKSGSVTFAAGQTAKLVTVSVKGNMLFQASRALSLVLSNPQNVTLSKTSASLTIRDNDGTWQNVTEPEDVNNDGNIQPVDVLNVIDDVNRNGIRQLTQALSTPSLFFDVNGDTLVTPADVLAVIDSVNREVAKAQNSFKTSTVATSSAIASAITSSAQSQTVPGGSVGTFSAVFDPSLLTTVQSTSNDSSVLPADPAAADVALADPAAVGGEENLDDVDEELFGLIASASVSL